MVSNIEGRTTRESEGFPSPDSKPKLPVSALNPIELTPNEELYSLLGGDGADKFTGVDKSKPYFIMNEQSGHDERR